MFVQSLAIFLLLVGAVNQCAAHKLPDIVPPGSSLSDANIINVVEQLKSEIGNIRTHYDDVITEMKEHYDDIISEIKTSHEADTEDLKARYDDMKNSQEAAILEWEGRYDDMKTSYDELKKTCESQESRYDQLFEHYVSDRNQEKIRQSGMQGNAKTQDKSHKNSAEHNKKIRPATKITPEKTSNVKTKISSSTEADDQTKKSNPEINMGRILDPAAYSAPDQLQQLLEMSEDRSVGFTAFQAYLSTAYNGNADDVLLFDDVRVNIGGVYDSAIGIFTVATAGLYIINRSHLAETSCDTNFVCTSLQVNGVLISCTCSEFAASTSKTELVQLAAGDNVWVQILAGSPCYNFFGAYNYNSFSGYLLVETI